MNKWINVNERLPKTPNVDEDLDNYSDPCLACSDKGNIFICEYFAEPHDIWIGYAKSGLDIGVYRDQKEKIIAWMPLPEPYKENDE